MKKLIFIDNEQGERASENMRIAQRRLAIQGKCDRDIVNGIELLPDFHKVDGQSLVDSDAIIITCSMFTENHFGSYDQLNNLLVYTGLAELKGKVFIDTATYLKATLERIIENEAQSVYVIRAIENNLIIHYDEDESKFFRLRFNVNIDGFLFNEDMDLNQLFN